MTYRPEKKKEWFIFKKCENGGCGRWRFKWQVKRRPIWVEQIKEWVGVNQGPKICGRCKNILQNAIKERNI